MNIKDFNKRFYHVRHVPVEQDFPLRSSAKPAAVLIPIVLRESLSVLFTRRAAHLTHHGGQISFPGGRYDESDTDLKETALRETEEETGLHRSHIDIIAHLPKFKTVSRYEVTPFVSLVMPGFELKINEEEVDLVFEVPLSHLIDQRNHMTHDIKRNGIVYPVYFIPWQGTFIWGATAAFLRTLSHHLQ